ncbi:Abi family protein [Amycolatopsis roodepoortensis]|uniref:Abi family protein n=1 Tax=Amycolatopsis roodepoortensis TaxID=700274 RepID=UPI000F8846D9|nr:Abi family protein [Amycolatopsis roodepoortensis]RSN15028.1 hypothetical protein DMC63_25270 [Streptomyces sp. WAC 05977]UUV28257.1 Abi family protein [Amycolatopsis roodepoortensis]
MTSARAGDWIETWLSKPRFTIYLQAANQDRELAMRLYEWNAAVSAAFHHDLCHLEVALRNAYDRALGHAATGGTHWVFQATTIFPSRWHKSANGTRYDVNETSRRLVAEAIRNATPKVKHPASPSPGKVIAELSFGFWRYLSARRHHDPLWVPYLHLAFQAGTDRRDVDKHAERLHRLRNRVAHHEPLLTLDVQGHWKDVRDLAALISPQVAAYIAANSSCARLLAARPC